MCVAKYASHYFSGAVCVPLDDQEKNICTLSSHRATRELCAKVSSHKAPVGAPSEGSMRIELRPELYAKGVLCGSAIYSRCSTEWACPTTGSTFFRNLFFFFPTAAHSQCKSKIKVNEPRHDKTNKVSVRPAKTQISLGIRPACSESSLRTQWVAKDPSFLHAGSEDSHQTGRMPRLIWVFAERTSILLVLSWGGSKVNAQIETLLVCVKCTVVKSSPLISYFTVLLTVTTCIIYNRKSCILVPSGIPHTYGKPFYHGIWTASFR